MFHLFYTSHMRESAAHSRWYCAHARTNSFEFRILKFLSWDKGKTVSGSRPRTTRKRSVSQRPHSSAPRSTWNELTIVFHHSLWQTERAPRDKVTRQNIYPHMWNCTDDTLKDIEFSLIQLICKWTWIFEYHLRNPRMTRCYKVCYVERRSWNVESRNPWAIVFVAVECGSRWSWIEQYFSKNIYAGRYLWSSR